MDLDTLLKLMVKKNASDLFITAGVPPSIKINGKLTAVSETTMSPEATRNLVFNAMNDAQRKEFVQTKECNFAISARGVGRFRVSAFFQRNLVGMVIRRIETKIPQFADLGLPKSVEDLSMLKRGLVLFVGGTGTGKSTSLAAAVDHRNRNSRGHIITIEDPIEFLHQHQNCIVTQREVGLDTEDFGSALKNTLRQAPDVVLIGEIRSQEIMNYAISFAETGHLCLATLHSNNANQALDRIVHFFPPDQHNRIFMDLSLNLRGIVAQQLVQTPDSKSRNAVVEVMLNSPLMSEHIRKGEIHLIKDLMTKSTELGMQTFDQSLYHLYREGLVSYNDAILHADSANDLRLMIKLAEEGDKRGATQPTSAKELMIEETD